MKTKERKTMVIYMKFCQGTERNCEIWSWQVCLSLLERLELPWKPVCKCSGFDPC